MCYSVSHTLLNNAPKNNKFKYEASNKDEVKLSIIHHLNKIRKEYNSPQAFMSWDIVPASIVKKNKLRKNN